MFKKYFYLILLTLTSCTVFKSKIPQPKTEFRGVWIATVVNIDWPKSGHDSLEKQKNDYLEILNFYEELNFNAVIVQIRAAGDTFYDSSYAPWSRFLTGKEGESPSDTNLLSWMITEAHQRGMEFHAWLNPYRATFDLKTEVLHSSHDYIQHPEWMVKYGKKYYYNPGLPEVQERFTCIINEVVANYDIDAIHFDDYFYPYTIKNEVFDDSSTFKNHNVNNLKLDDWRRSNIDSLVSKTHKTIKETKPWVQFGISPFGVWKNKATDPKGSDTRAGQTTYEDLYADPLLWMQKGWIDYLIPQVYWSMDLPVASHRTIVDWWSKQATGSNIYIGNGTYKIRNNSDKAWNNKEELPKQLTHARTTNNIDGNAFFSAKSLMSKNDDVVKHLKKKYYQKIALPPAPTKSKSKSKPLLATYYKTKTHVSLDILNLNKFRYVMVYKAQNKELSKYPINKLLFKEAISEKNLIHIPLSKLKGKKRIALTFINKYGQESEPILLHLKQINFK